MNTPKANEREPRRLRVFISYAHADGATAAQEIYDLLHRAGCEVWLDRRRLRGGSLWGQDVEQELNNCDALVAVFTPATRRSHYCYSEQMWALDHQKIVVPVITAGRMDLPAYLAGTIYRRYPDDLEALLADFAAGLSAPAHFSRRLRYDTIPNFPQNYIPREQAVSELRDRIFDDRSANIAVTALEGMGGIGKTVLAVAVCRDPAVQRAFPDGIAWVAFESHSRGDVGANMREVARALGEAFPERDDDLAALRNRYRTLLRTKTALVVVDNVWSLDQLEPLLVDDSRQSRFLFTTRDATIANGVAANEYAASLLTESEARELFGRQANVAVDRLPREADLIIERCNRLALAVAQIAASLREVPLIEWRDTLTALQHADVRAIEDRLPSGQTSFFKTLAVSFHALETARQQRYQKLAIMLKDVPMPLSALQTLWNVDEGEGRLTAKYFVERSLARWNDDADPNRGIALHDLQLEYLRALVEDQDALQLIHGALGLSAGILRQNEDQFASQVVGRLIPYQANATIAALIADLAAGVPHPWVKPCWSALHPPGTGLIRTLIGHARGVWAVALTPDGRRAVSASRDNTLKVWDVQTGVELWTLSGHTEAVTGVAISGDGRRAVSSSSDKTLRVWDLVRGREIRTLTGHSDAVPSVALTPDGARAVSASRDTTLKVWDLTTGEDVRTLTGHSGPVIGVAVTPNGRQVISASSDKTVRVWDLATGREEMLLTGHSDSVSAVAVTSDGRRVISASRDATLKVWDLETGHKMKTLAGHFGPVSAVAVTADGRRVVSSSKDKTLRVWSLTSGASRTFTGHSDPLTGVAVTPDGLRAVSAASDRTLKVWELTGEHTVWLPSRHDDAITALSIADGGKYAVSASSDRTLKLWDLAEGREVRTLAGHDAGVTAVAVTGTRAVSTSLDRTLRVWDLSTGRQVRALAGHADAVIGVAVLGDGRHAISASDDRTLKLWDIDTGRDVKTLVGHDDAVFAVAVIGDAQQVISASKDQSLRIWDLAHGEKIAVLLGHTSEVVAVAVAAAGRLAISASSDRTLRLWDATNGVALMTLAQHKDAAWGVAVSDGGHYAVSASWDNTVRMWDLECGEVLATFTCDGAARCCSFVGAHQVLVGDQAGRLHWLSFERTPHRSAPN
jgi:WD40 repeat protein